MRVESSKGNRERVEKKKGYNVNDRRVLSLSFRSSLRSLHPPALLLRRVSMLALGRGQGRGSERHPRCILFDTLKKKFDNEDERDRSRAIAFVFFSTIIGYRRRESRKFYS